MLVRLIADNSWHATSNPTGRLTEDWVKSVLASNNVPGGMLQNAAAMDPVAVQAIHDGIRTALGL